jgi:hypothetical protein
LVRHTSNADVLDPETGFIRHEHISKHTVHLADLSTSLLGVFELAHTKIELTVEGLGKYDQDCNPDQEVEVPIYLQDFRLNNGRHYWVLLIRDIVDQEVNYDRSNPPFKAKCVVTHTPVKWNFWHFSIRWRTEDGRFWHDFPETQKKKVGDRIGHEVRAIVKKFAKSIEPDFTEPEATCYMK